MSGLSYKEVHIYMKSCPNKAKAKVFPRTLLAFTRLMAYPQSPDGSFVICIKPLYLPYLNLIFAYRKNAKLNYKRQIKALYTL